MNSKFSVIKIISIIFLLVLICNSQAMPGAGAQPGSTTPPVFVTGFIAVDAGRNDININLTLRNNDFRGRLINNARITLNDVLLRELSTGNYIGIVKPSMNRRSEVGGRTSGGSVGGSLSGRNNNNLRLVIFIRGRTPIKASGNLFKKMNIIISPIYRKGVNIGDPMKVEWNGYRRDRNNVIFSIINNRGDIIFQKTNLMGNSLEFHVPKRMRPKGGILTFRVRKFEKRLTLLSGAGRGSSIELYSEASAIYNSYR